LALNCSPGANEKLERSARIPLGRTVFSCHNCQKSNLWLLSLQQRQRSVSAADHCTELALAIAEQVDVGEWGQSRHALLHPSLRSSGRYFVGLWASDLKVRQNTVKASVIALLDRG
jgi:hypothetical protein